MSSDVWIGAVTTLAGAVLGGAISFLLSRQQIREARRQRQEEDARERRRLSADRRFQAYADFLTRARTFRNAVESFYLQPHSNPSLKEIDSLLQSTNDASALVFLVVEDDATHEACRHVLRALSRARAVIHRSEPPGPADPWDELNEILAALLANSRTPHGTNWESLALPNRGTSPGSSGKTEGGQLAGRRQLPRAPRVTRQAAASRE